jgi:hypothetical protein
MPLRHREQCRLLGVLGDIELGKTGKWDMLTTGLEMEERISQGVRVNDAQSWDTPEQDDIRGPGPLCGVRCQRHLN